MDSHEYWKRREQEQLRHNITSEAEYQKCIGEIYGYMMDQIQKEINGFYTRYAKKDGITLSEAKKRVSKLDIEEYERKAAKYVKDKDFSAEANEEMRLYNATMKINRLEMLKANIGLELVDGFNDLQKYFDQVLTKKTLDEFERQAGILGNTVGNNEKAAHSIVNASFHNAQFSDRIWMYQDMMKVELSKLLQAGLIQGKHPRVLARHLTKLFGVRRSDAERLLRTELARVQTEAQKQSFERSGYDQYEFIALGTACGTCKNLDGKHFRVKDMMPGENAPPMHPNCRCSTAAYMDRSEIEKWMAGKYPEDSHVGNLRIKRSQKQLQKIADEYSKMIQKYTVRDSRWSGRIEVDDEQCKKRRISGQKKWSCDILLKSDCQRRTIVHELLHSCSASYMNPITYIRYGSMEEASVELLAREICANENIPFTANKNPKVQILYEINELAGIRDNDLDFSTSLFAKSLERRYNWLEGRVDKFLQKDNIPSEKRSRLEFLLSELKGHK